MEVTAIQNKIYRIRDQQVLLDNDLAEFYGVSTKELNQAVKRNLQRFPSSFRFQLTESEWIWVTQRQAVIHLRSQTVTSKGRGGRRYLPFVFTRIDEFLPEVLARLERP